MKNWIASIVVALAGLARGQAAGEPNIVLIMAGDMGYECVTANGGESYSTPNLDRLARGGMRFEDCYSQPICTPSRVQLMTGIYNQRNYIRFGLLDSAVTTFGHLAKRAGYATCIGGKWQLENGLKGPNHFGFDEYCLWQVTRRPSRYPNPGLKVNSTPTAASSTSPTIRSKSSRSTPAGSVTPSVKPSPCCKVCSTKRRAPAPGLT